MSSIAKSEGKNNKKLKIFYTWFSVCSKHNPMDDSNFHYE
jgi:hypothetical protein